MSVEFKPFKMPDLAVRPEGKSKTLKESYICLRRLGFPDRDLFIYPQGEFENFKGEIIKQKPEANEIVYPGDKVFIVAAVSGISELMPDLFTDHNENFFDEDFNARQGARRLFALFDSIFLKMLCRLEWIRDIYAGIYSSEPLINYLGELLDLPERNIQKIPDEVVGYVMPRLYGYLATEGAMRVYLETAIGLYCECTPAKLQSFALPGQSRCSLGKDSCLGNDYFLGAEFKGTNPYLDIHLTVENLADIERIIPGGEDNELLNKILRLNLPCQAEGFTIEVHPCGEQLIFKNGQAYLGYSTVLTNKDE